MPSSRYSEVLSSVSSLQGDYDEDDVSCLDPSVAALLQDDCSPGGERLRIAMMKMQQARIRGNSDYAAKIMEHAIEEGARDRQAWTLLDGHIKKLEQEVNTNTNTNVANQDDKKEDEDDDKKEDEKEGDKEEGEEDKAATSEEVDKLKKEVSAAEEQTKVMQDLLVECLQEEIGSVRAEQISVQDREERLKARIRSLQMSIQKLSTESTKELQESLQEIIEQQCTPQIAQCSVCHNHTASKAVIPCGHLCLCDTCTKSIENLETVQRKCPLCRGHFLSSLHIYTSK